MKRAVVVLAGLCFLCGTVHQAQAWSLFGKKAEESPKKFEESVQPAQPAAQPQKTKEEKSRDEAIKAKKAQAQRKLAELNNTEWQIELSPLAGKGKKEAETVSFKENKVSFMNYGKKGFPATNFTLTVQEDGVIVWETMQTTDKGSIAFWRGEMDAQLQTMRGVVSCQIDQKNKQDYSFNSISRKSIPASDK